MRRPGRTNHLYDQLPELRDKKRRAYRIRLSEMGLMPREPSFLMILPLAWSCGRREVSAALDIFWQVSHNTERTRLNWPFYSVVSDSMYLVLE